MDENIVRTQENIMSLSVNTHLLSTYCLGAEVYNEIPKTWETRFLPLIPAL